VPKQLHTRHSDMSYILEWHSYVTVGTVPKQLHTRHSDMSYILERHSSMYRWHCAKTGCTNGTVTWATYCKGTVLQTAQCQNIWHSDMSLYTRTRLHTDGTVLKH